GLGVEAARGDVTEPHSLEQAVAGCDWVFHLAGVRRAANREEFMEVNAEATRHLLEACLTAVPGLDRFVLAGSLGASGPSATGKREEDPLAPVEWYGESKAEAERIALSYGGRLPVAMARPPRIVGPGDRENLVFFRIVKAGFLLDLGGPPRPLSFVDVEDCARGFLDLAESPAAEGQAFFLASPGRTDLVSLQREVARALGVSPRAVPIPAPLLSALAWASDGVALASGLKLPLNRKLARQLLAPGWTCDPGKAHRLLGFEARVSLAESVGRAASWYREQGWL
ncbi:MAG TPA: NAD-dependent epimerase/dehydratase family protein, partial [Anaeromyxobacteraceae bacterium]